MYKNILPDMHTYSNVELRNPYISFDPTSVFPQSTANIPPGYSPYNIRPLRDGYNVYQSFQNAHSYAFPPTTNFDKDPANTLPKLETLFYREQPNFRYLDNPTPFNQNYDYQVQNKFINGALTATEGYPNRSDIKHGLETYRLNLGPVFF